MKGCWIWLNHEIKKNFENRLKSESDTGLLRFWPYHLRVMRAMAHGQQDGLEQKTDDYVWNGVVHLSQLTFHFVQWPFTFAQKCQNRVILDKWPHPIKRVSFDGTLTFRLNSRPSDFLQTAHFPEIVQFGDRLFLPLQTRLFLGKGRPPAFVFRCNKCRIGPKTALFHMTIYFHFLDRTLSELRSLSELGNASKNWEGLWN